MTVTFAQLQQDIETLAMLIRVHSEEDPDTLQHAHALAKADTPTRLLDIMHRLAALRDEKIEDAKTTPINTVTSAQLTPEGAVLKIEFTRSIKLLTMDATQAAGFAEVIARVTKLVTEHQALREMAAATSKQGTPIH